MIGRIDPRKAKALIGEGAVLIDIREANERARERIGGSVHLPLTAMDGTGTGLPDCDHVIFHCKSGARTVNNAQQLQAYAGPGRTVYILEGGLDRWRQDGLPIVLDRSKPIELQRQVQIVAGGVGLIGTILGVLISPWFLVVPGFIGAGLLFAGITGFCGMARILMRAPWNRPHMA